MHLMQAFTEDWGFTTREVLQGDLWFPRLPQVGPIVARGVTDGPDGDFERARLVFLGALACAQRNVRIVTPYFVPDSGLISAINVAALRGVLVEIVIPERSNLALVQWASTHQLWQILQRGCRVYLSPPPFDHTKIMLVDGGWSLIGSSNWDARSLRLNWEFVVECYDQDFAARLDELVDKRVANARRIRKEDVDARALPFKLRDGIARLAAPYL
jgi:cardiolipin synthase